MKRTALTAAAALVCLVVTATPARAELAIEDSHATTSMGNLIVGAPLGAVRPYVSGGAGLIRAGGSDVDEFFDIDLGFGSFDFWRATVGATFRV